MTLVDGPCTSSYTAMLTSSTWRGSLMLTVATCKTLPRRMYGTTTESCEGRDGPAVAGSAPLTAAGLVMLVVLAISLVGLAVDPRIITGAPAVAEASQVRRLDRHLHADARLDLHTVARVAPHAQGCRLGDGRDPRAGGRDHRRTGVARDDQPLQRWNRARRRALHHHGSGDRSADPDQRRGRRGPVASALRRSVAGLGASLRDGHHHPRRQHRWSHDATDHRAARRGCAPPAAWPSPARILSVPPTAVRA